MTASERDIPHGTPTGYFHFKCKCGDCRVAGTAHSREYRMRRALGYLDPALGARGLLPDYPPGAFFGPLTVSCWCERRRRKVDPDLIRTGYTFSCGWEGCSADAVSTWEAWVTRLLRDATGRQRAESRSDPHKPTRRAHRRTARLISAPCWCERKVRKIEVTELKAGRTWSCGIGCSRFTWQRIHGRAA